MVWWAAARMIGGGILGGATGGAGGALIGGVLGASPWKALQTLTAIKNFVDGCIPAFEESVEVVVYGNPNATKRELFSYAMSVAFGQIGQEAGNNQNFILALFNNFLDPNKPLPPDPGDNKTWLEQGYNWLTRNGTQVANELTPGYVKDFIKSLPPPFTIEVEYDMTGNSVGVRMSYRYNGLFNMVGNAAQALNPAAAGTLDPILRSVDDVLFGGAWNNYWLTRAEKAIGGGNNTAPLIGRILEKQPLLSNLLTFEPMGNNPDQGSSYLNTIVSQIFQDPDDGTNPPIVPPPPSDDRQPNADKRTFPISNHKDLRTKYGILPK